MARKPTSLLDLGPFEKSNRLSRISRLDHTCRLHPLGRNTTTCNLSHTLHFRGVNNTSGFPGFAARASVYLQTPLGGLPAWRIRNPQLQPSSSNCSQIFCNRSRASPIAAGYLVLQPIGCNCRHANFFSCLFFEYNLQLGGRAARWIRKPAIAAE